jgi:hypothetical protein
MSEQGSDNKQVIELVDTLLLRLLKTPPRSRIELPSRSAREGKEEGCSDSREAR